MKLENQVCTLEQAKRLKELGIIGASAFYWADKANELRSKIEDVGMFNDHAMVILTENIKNDWCYHAFTVAELGVMMPQEVIIKAQTFYIGSNKSVSGNSFFCSLIERYKTNELIEFNCPSEAEARATMLIHLLQNNLTTATDCNNRLNS